MDELKYLHTEGLKDIEIPDGLEDRLSMMIDQLEENEECAAKATVALPAKPARKVRLRIIQAVSVAACIALIFGTATILNSKDDPAHKDTFDNPETACIEAEKALNLLAYNLGEGMKHLEKSKEISVRTNNVINRTIEKLGNNE